MELEKLSFTKKDLNTIPENERNFFFFMQILLTEFNLLLKSKEFFLDFTQETNTHKVVQKSIHCHMVFLTLIGASKIYSGWEFLGKFYFGRRTSDPISQNPNSQDREDFKSLAEIIEPQLSREGKEGLKEIKKYFSRNNIIKTIRHKIVSHYDYQIVTKQFKKYSDNEPFEMYLSDKVSNCFSTAYFTIFESILSKLDNNKEKATIMLFDEIQQPTFHFRNFILGIVEYYTRTYLKNSEIIEISKERNHYQVSFPWFFEGDQS